MIKINLVLLAIAIFMLGVMPSVYVHTQDYLIGYALGREDGKTGGSGYVSPSKADVSTGVRSDDRLNPKLSCTEILKFDMLSTFLKTLMENNFLFSDNIFQPN